MEAGATGKQGEASDKDGVTFSWCEGVVKMLTQTISTALTTGEPYFTVDQIHQHHPRRSHCWSAYLPRPRSGPADRSSPAAQAAHRRLLRFHVIEQTQNGDRIEIPLVEQWARDRAFLTSAE